MATAKLTSLAIADLLPDPRNANKGTKRGAAQLKRSLKNCGAGRSIVLDRRGTILAGNKTAESAKALGYDKVAVVRTDGKTLVAVQRMDLDLTEPKSRARAQELAVADNRVGELNLEWDHEALGEISKECDLSGLFGANELEALGIESDIDAPEAQIDRAAELQEKWKTERGQIWEIGKHRLMCGSATDENDHARVLGRSKVDAVVTDPPYGVGVEYGSFVDNAENVRGLIAQFMPLVLKWPVVAISTGVRCLWDYPRPTWLLGWSLSRATGNGPWGFTCYHPVPVWGKDPYLTERLGGRPDTAVELSADRERTDGHPTVKPIAWWKWLIERVSTKAGRTIFDPFCGSGTTLVACEALQRVAFGIEIEPKYVAVALERMADMGLKPKLAA